MCRAFLTEATVYGLEATGKVSEKFRSNFHAELIFDSDAGETSDHQKKEPPLELLVDFTREDTARVSMNIIMKIFLFSLIPPANEVAGR